MLIRLCAAALMLGAAPVVTLQPTVATEAAGEDADDPAVWVHPRDVSKSLLLATNKVAAPHGAVVVYGLDGRIRQRVAGIDRPNNIDVQDDLAIVTERLKSSLRLFRVAETGLTQAATVRVFEGERGAAAAPMGIAIYKRPRDGAVFAIVGRKSGPADGYLWQYRIEDNRATKVRAFGKFSGGDSEVEAIAVDDESGFVYYADESCCIRKWHADPDHPDAATEIGTIGAQGFGGNREGIAIHNDYIVCTDQLPGSSRYLLYRRSGDQSEPVAVLHGPADSTDGIEVMSRPAGARFPNGFLAAMNSSGKNFLLFVWPQSLLPVR